MEQFDIFDFLDSDQKLHFDRCVRLIELFGGIGSQHAAFTRLQNDGLLPHGFESYRMCEIDKYAVAAYNSIHGTNYETSDITQLHASDLGIVDRDKYLYLLFYSFPCTDISGAGKALGFEEGSNTRSSLLWQVKRLLDECGENLPQILVMENVKNILSKKFEEPFQKWLDYLSSKGYQSVHQVLNATDYGIPQNRERVFVVSWLDKSKTYNFPKPFELEYTMQDFLEDEDTIDEKYYIPDEYVDELIAKGNLIVEYDDQE